jgi:hypothetical protein
MTRQMTITLNSHQYMFDVEFERRDNTTVYRIRPNKHFKDAIPDRFEMTRSDNSDKTEYSGEGLSQQGKEIADVISKQISLLPMQFAGGKGKGNI